MVNGISRRITISFVTPFPAMDIRLMKYNESPALTNDAAEIKNKKTTERNFKISHIEVSHQQFVTILQNIINHIFAEGCNNIVFIAGKSLQDFTDI